jgi:hypothetical protein
VADRADFAPPPAAFMLAVVGITAAYVVASEIMKAWFYREPQGR